MYKPFVFIKKVTHIIKPPLVRPNVIIPGIESVEE